MEEIIFNSTNEAFQMLANITGKKIIIPDKAEPKVALKADLEQSNNEAIIAEDDITKKIDQKIDQLNNLKIQIQDSMSQLKKIAD